MQLPGLSSEVDTTTTPEAIGYASHWNWKEENDFLAHEDTLITIFSILIVAATKLFLLAFSYEILQWIRKHSIHRKAHKWYYHYWAVQVLIVCTLSAVIYFELLKQHNKTALYIFIGSFGCDLLAFIFMLLITSKVLIWICSRAIISDFFGCKRSNICFCGLCEIKDSEYEAINPDSGRNFLIEMITLDNSSAKEEANGNSSPEVAVEGNSSGVVTQETSPTDITPAPAATEGEIQPDSENSFVKECVPPPLTLLYYCFPCCCCFCKLRCFSVFWLWCFPIVYYSSKRWKCFCCIYHGKSVNDRDCWCCACCIPCCSCISLSSNSSKDDPVCVKMLKCHACVKAREDFSCNIKNKEDWEKCRKHWHTCWTAITNIASLVIFLAFVSYLSQALPAIVISYYLSPTASLIRLGFFEVMIVVMLFEVAYVLFLMDKLTWLCYFNKKKEIPKEIEPESDSEDEHRKSKDEKSNKKENTLISKYIKKIQRGEKQEDLLIYDCQCEYCYTCTRQRKKLTKCCCCKAERNVRLLDCKKVECCDAIKQCHCLFVVTLIQILTMLFITGLSAVLLFFLLNVIIEQTSGANNEFRDILAIVPTIALNLWLLFKEGNVFHAVKNIVGKANKSVDHDPLSTAEEGRSAVHMHHTLSSHHRGSVY